MKTYQLFTPVILGKETLANRIVMAPMTRCRAIGNIPNSLMAKYYQQRAGAGLLITEGTSPSPNGLGYARIPGIYNREQIQGWKKITEAVHKKGSKIFVQLMHTGRISHSLNMPTGSVILAPSAIKAAGQMWTDKEKMQDFPTPKSMSTEELLQTKQEFVQAALNAMDAGFDGVELHAANGYLLEEFLSPNTNIRNAPYGGSVENRCRFVLELVKEVADTIGKDKTGIRLSPYGVANDMLTYPEVEATYEYLAAELNTIGIVYIHLVDHSAMGAPLVPANTKQNIRDHFKRSLILCGGYNKESAEVDIEKGLANLIGFGRLFLNNPDLLARLLSNWPLSQALHMDEFYSAGEKGYTDYPVYDENESK